MKKDWSKRLNVVIESNHKRPFNYGTWDCCLFVAECVEAMTGEDHMKDLRGYTSKEGAQKLIRAHPSKSLYGIMRALFGNPRPAGRRGDIVYTVTGDGPTIGVCIGVNAVFAAEPSGFEEISMTGMKVFRCG